MVTKSHTRKAVTKSERRSLPDGDLKRLGRNLQPRKITRMPPVPPELRRLSKAMPNWLLWALGGLTVQAEKDQEVLNILNRNSLERASIDAIKKVCIDAYVTFFRRWFEKLESRGYDILRSGKYCDDETGRWHTVTIKKLREVQRYLETLSRIDRDAWTNLGDALRALQLLIEVREKCAVPRIKSTKAPPRHHPEKEWAPVDRYLQARVCAFLTCHVDDPAPPRSKLNPSLTPAANATSEIMKCFDIKTSLKAVKDSYHKLI